MTTYQDPPLQSRRAVRQGERPEPQQPSSPFAPPQVPRNASGAGEPLSYVTQNRPPLPGYESPTARAEQEPADQPAPPEFPAAEQPAGGFRPRDYSPEARTAPPAWAPEDDRESGHVDYRTQSRANVVPPASLASSLSGEPSEQTFTRRELRALREAQGLSAPQAAPVTPPAPSTPLGSAIAEFDALTRRGAESAPEELTRRAGRRAAVPTESAPEDGLSVFDAPAGPEAAAPEAALPEAAAPEAPAAPSPATPTPLIEPAAPQTYVAPPPAAPAVQPIAPPPVAPAPVAPQQFAAPAPEQPAVVLPPEPASAAPAAPFPFTPPQPPVATPAVAPVAPTTGERPVGHWTNQSDLDDRTQVNGSSISRTIGAGSGAITTSALVLPSIPGQHMETGEIMLTDSVSLPANLAATGAHHSIDESDLDHLLDPGDHQAINTDSVPIRAVRAVSSHTNSGNPLLTAAKPNRGGRALTALIVSASGMVVVVVTLLVVALVNGGL